MLQISSVSVLRKRNQLYLEFAYVSSRSFSIDPEYGVRVLQVALLKCHDDFDDYRKKIRELPLG